MNSYILKGNICYSPTAVRLAVHEGAFVVCESGICRGVYDEIPESFRKLEVIDCGDRLILPGLIDLHIHAAQFALRGTGMDYELLDWLEQVAFPEEIRFADMDYASKAYGIFAERLKRSATTRAVMFATIHPEATLQLMDHMEQSGLVSCVGKVSMDRNALPMLLEKTSAEAEGPLPAEGPPPGR